MNKQEQIKKIENKIEELKQEVENLKNENKGRWIPTKIDEYYYLVKPTGYIDCLRYDNDIIDKNIIENMLVFETRDEAEHYLDYLKALKESSYEFTKEEWENGSIEKWSVYYNYGRKQFEYISAYNLREMKQKYFKTEKELSDFVSKWKKEIKEYEFGIYEVN